MSDEIYDKFVDSIMQQYSKGLQILEDFSKALLECTDYTKEDIVIIDADLGGNRQCKMVVCPKSCVVSGFGILPCDYFIGLEEVRDEQGTIRGWQVILEVPDNLKTSWEEINSRKSCEICSHYQCDENEDMCVAACLKGHNVADGVCEDWELMTFV